MKLVVSSISRFNVEHYRIKNRYICHSIVRLKISFIDEIAARHVISIFDEIHVVNNYTVALQSLFEWKEHARTR